jgi:hypothetical protein
VPIPVPDSAGATAAGRRPVVTTDYPAVQVI